MDIDPSYNCFNVWYGDVLICNVDTRIAAVKLLKYCKLPLSIGLAKRTTETLNGDLNVYEMHLLLHCKGIVY